MPFRSKSQLRTCYATEKWDCDKWLGETKSVCALPERSSSPIASRTIRKGEIVKGEIMKGPRGGRYFEIRETYKGKEVCTVRVYLKRKCKKCY